MSALTRRLEALEAQALPEDCRIVVIRTGVPHIGHQDSVVFVNDEPIPVPAGADLYAVGREYSRTYYPRRQLMEITFVTPR